MGKRYVIASGHPATTEAARHALEAGGKKLTAKGTLLRTEWEVRFFKWSAEQDPRASSEKWKALLAGPPWHSERVPTIEYYWGRRGPGVDLPADHFGTTASTAVELAAGKWRATTISDDGVRVWIDDKKVIDNWTWHTPTEDSAVVELAEGEHRIRIEHFEIDGHAQLHFMIERER